MTRLDTLLYWYTLTFSAALILTALGSGFNLTNLTTIAFFLPVPVFLLLQSLKRYYLWRQNTPPLTTKDQGLIAFPLKPFLTQPNPTFIISLVLLLTFFLISLVRSL